MADHVYIANPDLHLPFFYIQDRVIEELKFRSIWTHWHLSQNHFKNPALHLSLQFVVHSVETLKILETMGNKQLSTVCF